MLKTAPSLDRRYWFAISFASMCGTNLGDILIDVLRLSAVQSMGLLFLGFASLAVFERVVERESETYYWLMVLIVRAAATNIADFAIGVFKPHDAIVVGLTAALFVAATSSLYGSSLRARYTRTSADVRYWVTMLLAGILGTIFADVLGHSFPSVEIGWPASTLLASAVLSTLLYLRFRHPWMTLASYWIAIVVVRWWGTNAGDIVAHILSLSGSAAVTAMALMISVSTMRRPPFGQRVDHGR